MVGMKLIDASEVVTKKKTSKIEIKKIAKIPLKIITDGNEKNTVNSVPSDITIKKPDIVKPDIVKAELVSKTVVVETDSCNRNIRAIKLKEAIYYGPKNAHKNKFMRIYKKLGLNWTTDVSLNGATVDGWFNSDKSQYIIKLLEREDFKRFKFCGCDEIYDYFKNLGGIIFDLDKEDSLSSNNQNNKINVAVIAEKTQIGSGVGSINSKDTGENYKFIGADLWSGYRTKQLLKKVSDNLGIVWK